MMRLPKIRAFALLIKVMRDNYFLNPLEKCLRSHFGKARHLPPNRDAPIVLIQCAEDYFHFTLFGEVTAGLRACGPLRVDLYSLRGLRWGSTLSLRQMFWNSVTQNWLSDWKWRRLYGAYVDRTAYCATGWLPPLTAIGLWWTAWKLWRTLKTADDLAQLTARGIWIGDLVIDSYIRFKPAPAPVLDDLYLLVVIRQALKNVEKAIRYFGKNKPKLLLTSYATYIQHGIPARVAVQQGVLVRAFSNVQEFAAELTRDNYWNTRDGRNYKKAFSVLPDRAAKLTTAERRLSERLSGKIDSATSYMKVSAYGGAGEAAVNVRGMPVVFLHDFYDSVHVYRWICFHDFWNWACFTIDTLRAAGIPFAVKPHPNQIAGSSDVLKQMMEKYPDLNVIPSTTTNDQLIRSGMACAVTVYGTVASEMAFMGIPTISCGDNPHVGFDFCHTAQTQQEYAQLLINYRNLPGTPSEMRTESCIFHYMHNMHLDQQQQVLKDKIQELRRRLFFIDSAPSPQEVIEAANDFAAGAVFRGYCASLYNAMCEQQGDAMPKPSHYSPDRLTAPALSEPT